MPVSDFSYKQLLHDSVHPMINVLVHIRILIMFTGIFRVKRGGLGYYFLFPHCRFQCRCRSRRCLQLHGHLQKLSVLPLPFYPMNVPPYPRSRKYFLHFGSVIRPLDSRTRTTTSTRFHLTCFRIFSNIREL